jgi:hypothetical protein
LTTENRALSEQICQLSSALSAEIEHRKVAEEDNRLLCDKLRDQLQKCSRAAGYLQEILSKNFAAIENSLSILTEIRQQADVEA